MGCASFTIISDTFTPKVREAATKLPGLIQDGLEILIGDAADNARGYCPVRTGYLQSTIYGKVTGPLEAELGATADYAGFVEWGTGRMSAEPYLRPALELMLQEMGDGLLQALMDAFL
jgi:HK97 gp10 family phage protein